jgi:alkanesulfonate monooxygenase SsuD/methylene tetrahydromethanopterin reductase-like flavin-dependent oxidoreductase (luciferase family)
MSRDRIPDQNDLPGPIRRTARRRHGHAGTPETVRKYIAATAEQTGITYFVSDMAFGSIPYADAARSVELFAKEVMPAFR